MRVPNEVDDEDSEEEETGGDVVQAHGVIGQFKFFTILYFEFGTRNEVFSYPVLHRMIAFNTRTYRQSPVKSPDIKTLK